MGHAAQLSPESRREAAEMTLDNASIKVLETLAQYQSMPFLELTTVCDLGDDRLEAIINDLELRDLVKVSNRDNILEEIITLKKGT
jgi:hypothetical protein